MRNRLIAFAALVAVSAPQLGGQSPRRVNFVSCPIVQDTPTVPCWLSEYEGEQYYLGIQTDISADFDPPYLGHQVLVERILIRRILDIRCWWKASSRTSRVCVAGSC
jgi:hypothetical protein